MRALIYEQRTVYNVPRAVPRIADALVQPSLLGKARAVETAIRSRNRRMELLGITRMAEAVRSGFPCDAVAASMKWQQRYESIERDVGSEPRQSSHHPRAETFAAWFPAD